jgi:asparagine synthetase B (glutamine-hydrolysing)
MVVIDRSEATRLREEQDLEYRLAAEEELRDQERLRQEEEEAARVAEENRIKELEKEAVELSMQLHEKSQMEQRRNRLAPEPPQSADAATIRFQLPSSCQSAKLTRRFLKTDTVETVTDYLLLHFYDANIPVKRISLSTHFPKQELDDKAKTVEEAVSFVILSFEYQIAKHPFSAFVGIISKRNVVRTRSGCLVTSGAIEIVPFV